MTEKNTCKNKKGHFGVLKGACKNVISPQSSTYSIKNQTEIDPDQRKKGKKSIGDTRKKGGHTMRNVWRAEKESI